MITEEEIKKLEELADKISPLPWSTCQDGQCSCKMISNDNHPVATVMSGDWGDEYPDVRLVPHPTRMGKMVEAYTAKIVYGTFKEGVPEANAQYIAAACNAIPLLLAGIKEMHGRIQRDAQIIQELTERSGLI